MNAAWLALSVACVPQSMSWPLDEWRVASALPAGLQRERARSEISYRARDFAAAAAAARAGLQLAPQDLRLLQLQCGSALWLADAPTAADALARWQAALLADSTLAADDRAWWDQRWREQSKQVDELLAAAAARARCAERARWATFGWCIALVAASAWLALTKDAPVATERRDRG